MIHILILFVIILISVSILRVAFYFKGKNKNLRKTLYDERLPINVYECRSLIPKFATNPKCWKLKLDNGQYIWEYDEHHLLTEQTFMEKYYLGLIKSDIIEDCGDNILNNHDTSLVIEKATLFYSKLQCPISGHWPGDYSGPNFMIPSALFSQFFVFAMIKKINEADNIFGRASKPHRDEIIRYIKNVVYPNGCWNLHHPGTQDDRQVDESYRFTTVLYYVCLRLLGIPADDDILVTSLKSLRARSEPEESSKWGSGFELYGSLADYSAVDWPAQRDHVDPMDTYTAHSGLLDYLNAAINFYERRPWAWLRAKALARLCEHVRADDYYTSYTSIAPISKSFNMIVRWHADGPESSAVSEHLRSFKYFWWLGPEGMRLMGTNGSQFWDTSFAVQALMNSCEADDPNECAKKCITRAVANYFMDQQTLTNPIDYQKYYRHPPRGGFPFSTKLCGWIVSDCTAEAIVVLSKMYQSGFTNNDAPSNYLTLGGNDGSGDLSVDGPTLVQRLHLAVDCLLTYQNPDGGVASYETVRGPKWLELLDPAELFEDIMVEYTYTECTGASCRALITFSRLFPTYRTSEVQKFIEAAVKFMLAKQRSDGSWEGSWGVCFTYGAWLTMEALGAYGEPYLFDGSKAKVEGLAEELGVYIRPPHQSSFQLLVNQIAEHVHPSITKACQFLASKQRSQDGGWGEDFTSCTYRRYVGSVKANVVQTSWALLSLMSVRYPNRDVIDRGIEFLKKSQLPNGDWPETLCTGVFNKSTAIIYSNYKNIFPLWTLSRYRCMYHV